MTFRADQLRVRQNEHVLQMEKFRSLGEKVRELTFSLNDLKRPEGMALSEQDRVELGVRLTAFEIKLQPLIEEAQVLRTEGREAKIKSLEQGADSLVQSLSAIGQKLHHFKTTELHSL